MIGSFYSIEYIVMIPYYPINSTFIIPIGNYYKNTI
jgi:hypothetical protein